MMETHGWASRSGWMAGWALVALAAGCAQSGVGDPCIPESIPCQPDPMNPNMEICGYDPTESYVEASSVQCRTRVCLVQNLDGNPTEICPPDGDSTATNCITAQELDNRVFCSCRCDAPDDIVGSFEFCSCPSGFACEPVLPEGGDGIRGSYCVKQLQEFGE